MGLALLVLASCEQRSPDPPPPPSRHETAPAAPGALGARPASADEGVNALLTLPGHEVPREIPDESEAEPEPEMGSDDGGHGTPLPAPHPTPPSDGVAL